MCVRECVRVLVNGTVTCPPCSSWWRHSCWNASSPAQPAAPTKDGYPKRSDMTCETTREAAPNCRGRDRMQEKRKEHTTMHRKETMRKSAHARSAARLSVHTRPDWALGGTLSLPGTAMLWQTHPVLSLEAGHGRGRKGGGRCEGQKHQDAGPVHLSCRDKPPPSRSSAGQRARGLPALTSSSDCPASSQRMQGHARWLPSRPATRRQQREASTGILRARSPCRHKLPHPTRRPRRAAPSHLESGAVPL